MRSSNSRRSVPAKRSAKAFMSGARTAVRTTRTPDDVSTPAKRAPSFVSWSQTSTSGAPSMVAFRACCAHHSSVGAYVTAAWMIFRRRMSRKKSTKTSRNRTSYVWTKSHAHVQWLRRNVDQRWPSPRGLEPRMYRWTVRLQTRTPSFSNSPRMRSAPQRGLRAAISRISAAREVGGRPDGRERRRHKARNPARCQRRIVAGWTSKAASRQAGATRAARAMVNRCQGAHRTRPATFRCATMSCWRAARFPR